MPDQLMGEYHEESSQIVSGQRRDMSQEEITDKKVPGEMSNTTAVNLYTVDVDNNT